MDAVQSDALQGSLDLWGDIHVVVIKLLVVIDELLVGIVPRDRVVVSLHLVKNAEVIGEEC